MSKQSHYNSAKGKNMKLYNTLTRTVDEFVPRDPKDVKMYTCGPTVYHFAHIGNLRSYIMEDVLEKALNYVGFHVTRAMNITDVGHLSGDSDDGEDKMLKGAEREHKTVMEIENSIQMLFAVIVMHSTSNGQKLLFLQQVVSTHTSK